MANVSMETTLNAPADEVWEIVSDFNGLTRFIPAIAASTTEGEGIGAVRTLTLENGALILEKLESFQESPSRSFSYSIVTSPLPVAGYHATVEVFDIGSSRSNMTWSSSFEPDGVTEEEAQDVIRGIYSMGFDGLKKLFGG